MTFPGPLRRHAITPGALMRDFEQRFRDWPTVAGWPFGTDAGGESGPRVEVFEDEGNVVVRADVPGMRAEDLVVSFEPFAVVIRGERHERREREGRSFYMCEREYGSFLRRVPVPVEFDAASAEVAVADGVLTITAPRATG